MANDTANVAAGKPKVGGAIFRAPLGTTLPTDATTALNAAFKCIGYCSEDGLVESESRDVEEIKAWGGDVVGRTQTGYVKTYQFTAIETNVEVLKARYGDSNVTATGNNMTIKHTSAELPKCCWVFELLLGDRIERKVIPIGSVTETGDITYNGQDPVGYEMTLSTYADETSTYVYDYVAETSTTS